jgi:hypothetical protein
MQIAGSESGSISQRHGSADPDPYQNVMDPQPVWMESDLYPEHGDCRFRSDQKVTLTELTA